MSYLSILLDRYWPEIFPTIEEDILHNETRKRRPGPSWNLDQVRLSELRWQNAFNSTNLLLPSIRRVPKLKEEMKNLFYLIRTNWIDEIFALHREFDEYLPEGTDYNWDVYSGLEPEVPNSKEHILYQLRGGMKRKRRRLPTELAREVMKERKKKLQKTPIRYLHGLVSFKLVKDETVNQLGKETQKTFEELYQIVINSPDDF